MTPGPTPEPRVASAPAADGGQGQRPRRSRKDETARSRRSGCRQGRWAMGCRLRIATQRQGPTRPGRGLGREPAGASSIRCVEQDAARRHLSEARDHPHGRRTCRPTPTNRCRSRARASRFGGWAPRLILRTRRVHGCAALPSVSHRTDSGTSQVEHGTVREGWVQRRSSIADPGVPDGVPSPRATFGPPPTRWVPGSFNA